MNSLVNIKSEHFSWLLIMVMVFAFSCDDIFVEDISSYTVHLNAPTSGWQSEDPKASFRWDEVPGAVNYKLEVVTPGFSVNHQLVFEKLLEAPKFDTSLVAGEYEWRVKAMNSASVTNFFTSSFSILTAFNISSKLPVLRLPEDQSVSDAKNVAFSWDALPGASYYSFKIKKENWAGDSVVVTKLYSTSFSFRLDDGAYAWGVAAIDTATNKRTDYVIRNLIVNNDPPSIPQLLLPTNQDTLHSSTVSFSWRKTETNSKYTIEIYSDPEQRIQLVEKTVSDTVTNMNIEKSGSYFWRINSIDRYGKIGEFSPVSIFHLQLSSDIGEKVVTLLAPANKSTSIDKKVIFWWSPVGGTGKYNLQIVSPTFTNPLKLIYDQWITSNSVEIELASGEYEWRVKAVNGTFETGYSNSLLSVYNNDLTIQRISLIKPLYDELVNKSTVKFSWEKLNSNVNYHLLIKKDSWESGIVVQEVNTVKTELELPLLDGEYFWGVKATDLQNNSETEYSTRKIGIDLTPPQNPILRLPANNFITADYLLEFSWDPFNAADTKLSYTLEVFRIIANSVVSLPSKTTQQKSLGYNIESAGKYKWRVYATDSAGNQSEMSEFRYFEIQ